MMLGGRPSMVHEPPISGTRPGRHSRKELISGKSGVEAHRARPKPRTNPEIKNFEGLGLQPQVGYLSYSNRHADLMFELVSRRYQTRSTLITTNRPFAEWHEVFPNAACVVSLIDRLVHNAEIIAIDGESYRLKEARERTEQRARQRRGGKS
jgi:hypothetical protein